MIQTVPFTKDITFKTKIGEITSISLDHDLKLKQEDLITGNFYLKGTYKMLETSAIEEEYSYKIPCEIAISDEYDTFDAEIDIDDFSYEIVDDEILRVNIVVSIDNLIKKEVETKVERCIEDETVEEMSNEIKPEKEKIIIKDSIKNQKDSYTTYKVYVFKDSDTIEGLIEKNDITKEDLSNYNNLEDITTGTKVIIPSKNVKL